MFTFLKKTFHRHLLEQHIASHASLLTGKVLDVGAGGKRYNQYCSGEVTSIDINPKSGVEFGDVTSLTYSDQSFDTVCCIEVLEYVAAYEQALDEMARVLTPNGTLVLSVPFFYRDHGDVVRFTKQHMISLLESRFSSAEVMTFGNRFTARWDAIRHFIYAKKSRLVQIMLYVFFQPVLLVSRVKKNVVDDMYTGLFIIAKK